METKTRKEIFEAICQNLSNEQNKTTNVVGLVIRVAQKRRAHFSQSEFVRNRLYHPQDLLEVIQILEEEKRLGYPSLDVIVKLNSNKETYPDVKHVDFKGQYGLLKNLVSFYSTVAPGWELQKLSDDTNLDIFLKACLPDRVVQDVNQHGFKRDGSLNLGFIKKSLEIEVERQEIEAADEKAMLEEEMQAAPPGRGRLLGSQAAQIQSKPIGGRHNQST